MFKKLGEISEGRVNLLTVRCTDAWLEREPVPTVFVRIDDEMEALTTSRERREHYYSSSALKKQLKLWKETDIPQVVIADRKYPLEVVTGDTGLVLVVEGRRYLVSMYRDIYPEGWLMPGGCPRSKEELLHPKTLAMRECAEEVVVADTFGRVYNFYPSPDELQENIEAWEKEGSLKVAELVSLPMRQLTPLASSIQRLVIFYAGQESVTEGVNVTVDASVASLPVTVYWEVFLPIKLRELRIFDGEKLPSGTLLNRPVRLTRRVGNRTRVVARFSRGDNIDRVNWCLPALKQRTAIV